MSAFPDHFAVMFHVGISFSADEQYDGIVVKSQLGFECFALWMVMNGGKHTEAYGTGLARNNAWVCA
ncbi:hypothetical protein D3C75_1237580 [compost metagenome]